ncbi:TRAP transporter small permease [Neobacillus niacini]|uniref:TRAP transporter small permease n=1 Tax=Neobacillus niacini TaxID=86668 RepID=UPI00300157E0
MQSFSRIITAVNQFLGLISGGLILIISILICLSVVSRYFFEAPILWVNDLGKYFLLVITFFSIAYAMQENAHVNADFVTSKLRKSLKTAVSIIAHLFSFGYAGILLWKTFELFLRATKINMKTSYDISIPTSWLYLIIMIGSILLLLVLIVRILEMITGKKYMKMPEFLQFD